MYITLIALIFAGNILLLNP